MCILFFNNVYYQRPIIVWYNNTAYSIEHIVRSERCCRSGQVENYLSIGGGVNKQQRSLRLLFVLAQVRQV